MIGMQIGYGDHPVGHLPQEELFDRTYGTRTLSNLVAQWKRLHIVSVLPAEADTRPGDGDLETEMDSLADRIVESLAQEWRVSVTDSTARTTAYIHMLTGKALRDVGLWKLVDGVETREQRTARKQVAAFKAREDAGEELSKEDAAAKKKAQEQAESATVLALADERRAARMMPPVFGVQQRYDKPWPLFCDEQGDTWVNSVVMPPWVLWRMRFDGGHPIGGHVLRAYLEHLIPDAPAREYLLKLMKWKLEHPAHVLPLAVLIAAEEQLAGDGVSTFGTGRTAFITRFLAEQVFTRHNSANGLTPEHFDPSAGQGRFRRWSFVPLAVGAEFTVHSGGGIQALKDSARAQEIMRQAVELGVALHTESEKKGVDAEGRLAVAWPFLATNNAIPFTLPAGDRRCFAVDCGPVPEDVVREMVSRLAGGDTGEADPGMIAGAVAWILDRPGFASLGDAINRKHMPETAALARMTQTVGANGGCDADDVLRVVQMDRDLLPGSLATPVQVQAAAALNVGALWFLNGDPEPAQNPGLSAREFARIKARFLAVGGKGDPKNGADGCRLRYIDGTVQGAAVRDKQQIRVIGYRPRVEQDRARALLNMPRSTAHNDPRAAAIRAELDKNEEALTRLIAAIRADFETYARLKERQHIRPVPDAPAK